MQRRMNQERQKKSQSYPRQRNILLLLITRRFSYITTLLLVPFFWPSVPSSNVVHLQYRDMSSSDIGITGPGNPLFVLPLPWALPFPIYGTTLHSYFDTKKRQNETPSAHQCSMSSTSDSLFVTENNELSSKLNMLMKTSSCTPVGSAIGGEFTYPGNSGIHSEVTLLMPEKLSCFKPVESVSQAYEKFTLAIPILLLPRIICYKLYQRRRSQLSATTEHQAMCSQQPMPGGEGRK